MLNKYFLQQMNEYVNVEAPLFFTEQLPHHPWEWLHSAYELGRQAVNEQAWDGGRNHPDEALCSGDLLGF